MNEKCEICSWINELQKENSPYLIKELSTGYAVISKYQYKYYKGYTLFLCKTHVSELHELDETFRIQFLKEMSDVAKAVFKAVKPNKLNYEMLGNEIPHVHWHIFPRFKTDPQFNNPIWVVDKAVRQAQDTSISGSDLNNLRASILKNL